jgi:hypothetical protein
MLETPKALNTHLNTISGRLIAKQRPSLLNKIIREFSDSDKLDSENFKDITTFASLALLFTPGGSLLPPPRVKGSYFGLRIKIKIITYHPCCIFWGFILTSPVACALRQPKPKVSFACAFALEA